MDCEWLLNFGLGLADGAAFDERGALFRQSTKAGGGER